MSILNKIKAVIAKTIGGNKKNEKRSCRSKCTARNNRTTAVANLKTMDKMLETLHQLLEEKDKQINELNEQE